MRTVVIIMLLMVTDPALGAQDFQPEAAVGYAVLSGKAGSETDDGVLLGLGCSWRLDDKISLQTRLLHSVHDDEAADPGDCTIDLTALTFGPCCTFDFEHFDLDAGAGLGVYFVDYRFRPELPLMPPYHDDDYEAGLYGGIGLNFVLGPKIDLVLALRYHWIIENEVLDGDMLELILTAKTHCKKGRALSSGRNGD